MEQKFLRKIDNFYKLFKKINKHRISAFNNNYAKLVSKFTRLELTLLYFLNIQNPFCGTVVVFITLELKKKNAINV